MKAALVTGATSGIGRAAALALADDGWWVLASGRDQDRGAEVGKELQRREAGDFLAADLTATEGPGELVRSLVERRGRVDAVVYSAGVHFLATAEESDPEDVDRLMDTNLRGAFLLIRAAIPVMRDGGGGVIVNISSEAGLVAVPGQAAYNVSKAGLLMLTKSIAVDHAKDGIRAVAICPGTTRTPLVEEAIASAPDPEAHARWLAGSRPANRLGTPEEIAAVVAFVVSERVGYMTGTEIVIDGGYTAV
jgi:NAD(P)-dependent dehydrogenase (short-subunit alcohol dehydrogenase family)